MSAKVVCPKCYGVGTTPVIFPKKCAICAGTGTVETSPLPRATK